MKQKRELGIRGLERRPFAILVLVLSAFVLPRDALAAPKDAPPAKATPTEEPKTGAVTEPVDKPAQVEDAATKLSVKDDRPKLSVKDKPEIQPTTVTTKALPTGENKTGVSAQSISVPKGPGTIEGMGESFSAQASTGIATFSVPFALPKARGDVQPSLGLSYSSARGSGVAGVGWSVGVPFIARQTDRGLPSYDDEATWHWQQDRFVYNGGQELVPVVELLTGESVPEWAGAGWQYFRPRVEGSYLRFFWNPTLRLWRVQSKSGVVLELGVVGGETDAIETDPHGAKIFRWNLKRQIDAHGNEVRYYYDLHDGNLTYLTDIYFTAPAAAQGPTTRSAWAYHAYLDYSLREDTASSFRRGWETVQRYKLASVEVLGKVAASDSTRRRIRKYTLSYASGSHMLLLDSVQVEGRCSEAEAGQRCTLPPMKFGYTHVKSNLDGSGVFVDGFEVVDPTVRSMTNSPKHSVNEDYTDLYDVNADGLPDVVTMMPGLYGGKHALWIQGKNGDVDTFGVREPMGVLGVLGASASVISKHNPNVAALDIDADAIINLLHMPKVKTYSVYAPEWLNEWTWVGRPVATSDNLDARIDLGSDADEIRVFDVNGDGLVDVVETTGTALKVWFSLGRYPGGDGLFGSAYWDSPDSATLSMAPVMRCVPHSSLPVRFSDPEIKLADMNGDGLADIVRIRKGDIRYWPGRGDGTFGTGPLGCAGGSFSTNSFVQMEDSPWYTDPDNSGLRLNDVNGDGTADLVQIRFKNADIWYNVDGNGWQDRRILNNTPASPSYQQRVRLVDMNGSGTADILWGDGLAYKYVDLSGGTRPWLLNRVENGLGKATEVSYTTSTAEMLDAREANNDWSERCPTVLHMVERVTVRDNLGTVGRPDGEYVTEYTYRDPHFDGVQREFRGFAETTVRTVGDANSPTSESRTEFLLGRRPDGLQVWEDNPHEALKGLPSVAETYDPATGVYLSTTGTTYALRKLYEGPDGRGVYVAFAKQTDAWRYDTSGFDNLEDDGNTAVDDLILDSNDELFSPSAKVRAQNGTAHTRSAVVVDRFGNRKRSIAYGTLNEGDFEADEIISTWTVPELVPALELAPDGDWKQGNWAWRTVESWVEGNQHSGKRNWTKTTFNSHGDPIASHVHVSGSQGVVWDGDVPAGSEPMPTDAPLQEMWYDTSHTVYDDYGNAVFTWAAGNRCAAVSYDSDFMQLPMQEHVFVREPAVEKNVPSGSQVLTFVCGADPPLTAQANYDRGLQAVVDVVDINGGMTVVEYDPLGRIEKMWAPNPDGPGVSGQPSLLLEYHLPDEPNREVSLLLSRTQDGLDHTIAEYHETYTYIDGLGRTIATLSEADPTDDGFAWVVEGLTDYDKKGAERRKYLAWPYDGDPAFYDHVLHEGSPARYGQRRYDAFGRAIQTMGLDGTVTLHTAYHALSADAWDAEDLGPGPHQGTHASERKDGHGRVIETTERVKSGTAIEPRYVRMEYLPTGEPTRIARAGPGSDVERTIQYDSLGRMVGNFEPTGGPNGWRYLYNIAGDLVANSDPRGCGQRFAYDLAGRLQSEDYVPCESRQAPYTAAAEVTYEYDSSPPDASEAFQNPYLPTDAIPPEKDPNFIGNQDCRGTNFTNGRLVAVTDRAQRSLTCYDGRGRIVEVAKRLASPGGVIDGRWYNRRASHDGADRPTHEGTGSTALGHSQVETTYTARGKVWQVNSTFGMLVNHVKRDADGLVKQIQYGDAAATTTAFTYDDLRRLRNLTTYRSNLNNWMNDSNTKQMLLQDEQFTYDRVGNPVEIRDWRDPAEWEIGAKPVTRKMQYDDLYRLSRIDYQYPESGSDLWKNPYAAELDDETRPQPSPHADFTGERRIQWQTYAYDWLGNTATTHDDLGAFYDRSLGEVTNDRYKLKQAEIPAGSRIGKVNAEYDDAGNLTELKVERHGHCAGAAWCVDDQDTLVQHFAYDWDEVGRLVRARRWDMPDPAALPPEGGEDAELNFTYDSSDQRVRKTSGSLHTLYIFASLELRGAEYVLEDGAYDYERTSTTEVPYLLANGVRLARVVYTDAPELDESSAHVFLELGDHLGSTSVVVDHGTGELVQRSTAYAYGAPESSHRPDRWKEFREDYRFTGKEDDVEVGLVYFGKRFYNPLLQRWISPDPLAVHAPGEADLNLYAYVHGKALAAVDPVGLSGVDRTTYNNKRIQSVIEALADAYNNIEYQVRGGRVVSHTAFYENTHPPKKSWSEKTGADNAQSLRIGLGKQSPRQVRVATQRVLDALGSSAPTRPVDIYQTQRDYGIGIDCSGFARRVLARIRGGRQPKGFEHDKAMKGSLNIRWERNGLLVPGWSSVAITELRTGDVLNFASYRANGQFRGGHKTVVHSHSVFWLDEGESGVLRDKDNGRTVPLEAGDRMHAITVYASWGAGGVGRQNWFYSEQRDKWYNTFKQEWVDNPYNYETYEGFREN